MDNRQTDEPEPTGDDTDTIIEVRNASVAFQSNRGRAQVLEDVSIDIERGETLGIVGESGSGKSMFASALVDAVQEPGTLTGEVTYYPEDGEPIDLVDLDDDFLRHVRWEEISMVFQGAQSSFNPTRTVKKHFQETLDAHGHDREEGMDRARELLGDVYLDPEAVMDAYPHELSGGQKQRILIALALLLDPEVLLMDEPTEALDLLMQRTILNLLYDIREKYGLTMVFIGHDLPLVAGFAHRLAIMYAFEFVELGDTSEVLSNPSHPYTRALFKAVPTLTTPFEEMQPIAGESPDPVNRPKGCSYHPRCPLADDRCTIEHPDLTEVGENQEAACFYADQAADAIPLSLEDEER